MAAFVHIYTFTYIYQSLVSLKCAIAKVCLCTRAKRHNEFKSRTTNEMKKKKTTTHQSIERTSAYKTAATTMMTTVVVHKMKRKKKQHGKNMQAD